VLVLVVVGGASGGRTSWVVYKHSVNSRQQVIMGERGRNGRDEEAKTKLSSFVCKFKHLSTWPYFGIIMADISI